MAEPEISLSYDFSKKVSIWSMQKKILRSMKAFGLTKPKLNFLATTKEGIFWRKKAETFVEKKTLPTVKYAGGSIMFWGPLWQLVVQEILCECKEEWIPTNIQKFERLMFKGQSRHWSWREVIPWRDGYSIMAMIKSSIPQNQTWSNSRRDRKKVLVWAPQTPDLNIIENLWREISNKPYMQAGRRIFMICQEEWGIIPKARFERLLAAIESCYSCWRRSYKVLTDRVPKLLHGAFFL